MGNTSQDADYKEVGIPISFTVRQYKKHSLMAMIIACTVITGTLFFIHLDFYLGMSRNFFIVFSSIISIGLIILGALLYFCEVEYIIDGEFVFARKNIFLGRSWKEPLVNYRGLLLSVRDHAEGLGFFSHYYHVIELYHCQPSRTVEMYKGVRYQIALGLLKEFRLFFQLPALQRDGRIIRTYNHTEFGEEIKQIVSKMQTSQSLSFKFQPPPKIRVKKSKSGDFTIILGAKWLLLVAEGIGGAIITMILSLVLMKMSEEHTVYDYLGFGASYLTTMFVTFKILSAKGLRIKKDRLSEIEISLLGEKELTSMNLESIRKIRVGRLTEKSSRSVIIVGDTKLLSLGGNLPAKSKIWLRNCLKTIIAGYHLA